jgi:malate dehydrogenase (oxaloacetate-decarboxylating)(NADP+)
MVNTESDPRYREYWQLYHRTMERRGVSAEYAKLEMRRRSTLIGATLVRQGEADTLLCGTVDAYQRHLRYIDAMIGRRPGANIYAAMNALLLPGRTLFIADTYVNYDPTAEQLVEIAVMAAEEVRRFGIVPKVALLSHSSFGSIDSPTSLRMRDVLERLRVVAPQLEVEGEMHGDAALSEAVRAAQFPNSRLRGEANLLIMPSLDAANISFNLLKQAAGDGITIGPILLGAAKPVHIITPSSTVRRIVNMTALAVVDAGEKKSA